MDHDRSSGEGVGCQEYTLIKMRVKGKYHILQLISCLSPLDTLKKQKRKKKFAL